MPKKGRSSSSTSRKAASKAARQQGRKMNAGAVAVGEKAGLYLDTIGEGGAPLQYKLNRIWDHEQTLLESDLRRLQATETANIPLEAKRMLHVWMEKADTELHILCCLWGVVSDLLGHLDFSLSEGKRTYDEAPVVPPLPPKQSRSRKASTKSTKSQK